jgi:hypothetical protein
MTDGAYGGATDQVRLHLTGPEGSWTIYGMELVLVPWMD